MTDKKIDKYTHIFSKLEENRGKKTVLFIRHGEKEKNDDATVSGKHLSLTPVGKATAKNLGTNLARANIRALISSPLKRCMQTCENIKDGANADILIEDNTLLGNHGSYVIEPKECSPLFREKGDKEVVLEYIEKGILPGFREMSDGSKLLLNMAKNKQREDGLVVFCSHDAIIMAFIAHYLKYNFNKRDWLGFLEGPLIFEEEGCTKMLFRDTQIKFED